MFRPRLILAITFLAGASVQADDPQPAASGASPATAKHSPAKLLDETFLPNVFRIHQRVLSGGQPSGDEGFAKLKELGVKAVISVDGARPDVALAREFGLRYVHLPHGYDGVPENRAGELAKALRELPGPIYIHCHHGKHRSPAAAAVACVSAGLIPPEAAIPILEAAGTSKAYRGLYQSAEAARPIAEEKLDALKVEFKEVAEIPAMADAMVEIEHRFDHLKQIAANGWKPLTDHPDVAPAHEALMLREHMTELLRTDEAKQQPAKFRQLLRAAEARSEELGDAYAEWQAAGARDDAVAPLSAALDRVNQNCAACHTQFRDVPLSEKAKR